MLPSYVAMEESDIRRLTNLDLDRKYGHVLFLPLVAKEGVLSAPQIQLVRRREEM
jgi:hypothetical protein